MPLPPHIQELRKHLFNAIQPEGGIVAVYLFGSFQKREFDGASDIDLAFLIEGRAYALDPLKAISPAHMIAAEVGMTLNMATDVTILNTASLEIAYEIVTTGQCLCSPDQDKRLEYECKIKGMYFDFMPFILDLRTNRLNRLQSNSDNK